MIDKIEVASLSDLDVGARVELSPHTDAWMSGDRMGEVVKVGRTRVSVLMDRSGRTLRLPVEAIGAVIQGEFVFL